MVAPRIPVITVPTPSAGELRLSGSITSSGDLIFNSTGSLFDYILSDLGSCWHCLLALNNNLPEALRMLRTQAVRSPWNPGTTTDEQPGGYLGYNLCSGRRWLIFYNWAPDAASLRSHTGLSE